MSLRRRKATELPFGVQTARLMLPKRDFAGTSRQVSVWPVIPTTIRKF